MELLQSMIRAYNQCEPEIKQIITEMTSAYVLCDGESEKKLMFDTIIDGLYPFLTTEERIAIYNEK